jgi:hypothetical protein
MMRPPFLVGEHQKILKNPHVLIAGSSSNALLANPGEFFRRQSALDGSSHRICLIPNTDCRVDDRGFENPQGGRVDSGSWVIAVAEESEPVNAHQFNGDTAGFGHVGRG